MWIVYAFGSALFAGLTAILAKCGIRKTDSTVATAIRTIIVLFFSWFMVFLTGSQSQLSMIDRTTWLFLVLSGLATGASWLCYFRALQIGDINKVVPIDKSSTVLTIILAFVFLGERISLPKAIGIVLIAAGTFLMIEKKRVLRRADAWQKLASLCGWLGGFCKSDLDSRKNWHFRCRFQFRDGHPHGCCSCDGMDYGFC